MNSIKSLIALTLLVGIGFLVFQVLGRSEAPQPDWDRFAYELIEADGPQDPWGKTIGSLRGNGSVDLLVGGHASEELVWYKAPDWTRQLIARGLAIATDLDIADMDQDGLNDIVVITSDQLLWLRNPDWTRFVVANIQLHDIEAIDIDADGTPELIGRNQGAFGGSGNTVYIFRQLSPDNWRQYEMTIPDGEGIAIGDLDLDGKPDLVVNQVWLRNSGTADVSKWNYFTYTNSWQWPHASIFIADINGDGRPDIIAAPAELEGQHYRISWFRSPSVVTGLWDEAVIDGAVEAVHHSLVAADIDLDGRVDIATAEMHQGEDPDQVKVYLNLDGGSVWEKKVVGTEGSHSLQAWDVDDDGDTDLIGANWSGPDQSVGLWRNLHCPTEPTSWERHVLDNDKGSQSVFVLAADLNGDYLKDVITGGWWYRNPGSLSLPWPRQRFSESVFHAAMAIDVDGDGDMDVLATRGQGSEPNSELLWAINDGSGAFELVSSVTANGDFLQGIAAFEMNGQRMIGLSWHGMETNLEMLEIGELPGADKVTTILAPPFAQDEALSSADIDRDGDTDLVLGTSWLENRDGKLVHHTIFDTTQLPDRNVVADVDGDGQLDVIVGYEAISQAGRLAWYSYGDDPIKAWTETEIARIVGPMSVDAGDVDLDGDIDIVAGEHNLLNPDRARLFFFENADSKGTTWIRHLVHQGDEHHDGAQLVDMDNDGDLDILSIGWGHNRVLLYENQIRQCPEKRREEE